MKRILFVTDTYHPDSSATTNVFRRTMEEFVKLGFAVDTYPTELSGNHFTYPNEYNGVRIIKPDFGSRKNEEKELDEIVSAIEKTLDSEDYDFIFSGAVNFKVNFLVHRAIKGRKCVWFPTSYDPYAFDPHITAKQRNEYISQEINALKDATKIFFLTEFKDDYVGSPIEDKIVYFNLPCIREIIPDRTHRVIEFDNSYINCVFLGDFYYGIENTDFIFRLFDELCKKNSGIRLYTVGNLGDYGQKVELWQKKLGDKYYCYKRISQIESYNVLFDCDVLVSMGHDSSNMCPSKVIDFVSSGKPILHIQKIENCCGKKYLTKYPNKYCVYQNDELGEDKIKEIENFILTSKGRTNIPFGTVKELYSDFTMESLIEKTTKELRGR